MFWMQAQVVFCPPSLTKQVEMLGVIYYDGDNTDAQPTTTQTADAFPFLGPVLQQRDTAMQDADETVVTTADGRAAHNLHEDIFYIPDPSLAFIGVSTFASTFSLYDFQAQVLAAVFSGKVRLPPMAEMRAE